jgi:hypothetical protein
MQLEENSQFPIANSIFNDRENHIQIVDFNM